MAHPDPTVKTTRSLAYLGLWALAVLMVAFTLAILRLHQHVDDEIQVTVNSTLTSVRLSDRMRLDVANTLRILQAHVHTTDPQRMAALEAELDVVERDFDSAATALDRVVDSGPEAEVYSHLHSQAQQVRRQYATVLDLSRKNLDVRSQAQLDALSDRFAELEREGQTLARMNDTQAQASLKKVSELQWRANATVIAAMLVVLLGCVGIGAALLALQRRKERAELRAVALEAQNRELDAFAGRVAHDLRGPLTAINLASASLLRRMPGEESSTGVFLRSVKRLDAIIQDLLTLSKLSAATRGGSCDPVAVVADAARDFQPRLQASGATFDQAIASGLVACPPGLLHQVLWNLMENAVSYAAPQRPARIEITGRSTGRWYELVVADNGIGMSEDEARQAFKPFYRGACVQNLPGTGLGLAIVQRVVEANGGNVSVTSTIGHGTTFLLRFPQPLRAPVRKTETLIPART